MKKDTIHYKNDMAIFELSKLIKNYIDKNTILICVGTDRCIGDSLGPIVGTFLTYKLFPLPVYGSISSPIHALNLIEKVSHIKLLHPTSNILAIDACLGDESSIGEIQFRNLPLHPGKGVGKTLPHVGDTSIIGIVDCNNGDNIFINNTIRLSFIVDMATVITESLFNSLQLNKLKV
ncbi:spore protease YyaC [Clostridium algidicarnis]|uniref:Spore protease YyaC n=2 Tax=Clostridium algidicarnis TaxID=37659 RepID=A0ABS6C3R6_9CLOT|nr:spore protease YyaC [Clostridium algidicarnis]MBB6630986.1 spore protease YyaC [Clostridium algidicarnis]MBB6698163.1 spore protease YyaC [Clostridium algidicarnis]MBU3194203.1 spore protease YyaC [Clostridium algidicarnis]MBU3205974.1 spore protease YyaC [Clostridium algidicarnis]MBU3220136.1 spore protease YyaC [Clostridium algidicarnis]